MVKTRSQAARMMEMEEHSESFQDTSSQGFEERITLTLKEVQNFLVMTTEENKVLREQLCDLRGMVKDQGIALAKFDEVFNSKIMDLSSRVSALECFMENKDRDTDNHTQLLNHIDAKLSVVNDSLERVHVLEEKLKEKLAEPEKKLARNNLKPVQLPPAYDGSTPWEAFRAQFDIIAEINSWNIDEKASFLAASLKGNATMVLSNLTVDNRKSFESLAKALSNRFGTTHQSELARAKFKTRVKKRDESYPELVSDLERLVKLAYPNAEAELQDTLAKDQFVDAIVDEEIRMKVRQGRPKNVQCALEVALELESSFGR